MTKPTAPQTQSLSVYKQPGETDEQALARTACSPVVKSACVGLAFTSRNLTDGVSVNHIVEALSASVKSVQAGDMRAADEMLVAQAATLDAVFYKLLERAANNMGEHLVATETYMRLALKAQSQARATWESLSKIKNPPQVAFVRQANIANGPQQVNNGVASEPTRAEEKAIKPTELLEHDHGQRLDTGTASTASAGDPVMATVGTLNRAAHGRGKGRRKP